MIKDCRYDNLLKWVWLPLTPIPIAHFNVSVVCPCRTVTLVTEYQKFNTFTLLSECSEDLQEIGPVNTWKEITHNL